MQYMIKIDPDQVTKVEQALWAFSIDVKLVPYAIGEYGTAVNMDSVWDYYERNVRREYPDLLPWGELTEHAREEFGLIIVGEIGYMFPPIKITGFIPAHVTALLMGRDHPLEQDENLDLPQI